MNTSSAKSFRALPHLMNPRQRFNPMRDERIWTEGVTTEQPFNYGGSIHGFILENPAATKTVKAEKGSRLIITAEGRFANEWFDVRRTNYVNTNNFTVNGAVFMRHGKHMKFNMVEHENDTRANPAVFGGLRLEYGDGDLLGFDAVISPDTKMPVGPQPDDWQKGYVREHLLHEVDFWPTLIHQIVLSVGYDSQWVVKPKS